METNPQQDMTTLSFDPPDGFLGRNIFPPPTNSPGYMELWELEKSVNFHDWRMWIGSHYKMPIHYCFIYLMGIFLGKLWMRRRQGFGLKRIMICWNLSLALFSLFGFLRSMPEVVHLLNRPDGFYRITCSREGYNSASGFWSLIGTFSKSFEYFIFGDRWDSWHHSTVMLYTWGTYEYLDPCHRWFIVMNYFIHAVMYTYYGLRAKGIKLHPKFSMTITCLQLFQMIAGVGLNLYSLGIIYQGRPCARRVKNIQFALAMYGSYLVLFGQFFYERYIAPRKVSGGKCHCH